MNSLDVEEDGWVRIESRPDSQSSFILLFGLWD